MVFNLRNGKSFVVVLNGAATVRDVITKINSAGNNKGQLVASFDEAKQQLVLTDTTTAADPVISASTSVTQTGSPVFYRRNGGTAIAVPFQQTTTDLKFALRVGTQSERFFVTVAGKN